MVLMELVWCINRLWNEYVRMYVCMHACVYMYEWVDGWLDGWMYGCYVCMYVDCMLVIYACMDGWNNIHGFKGHILCTTEDKHNLKF